MDGLERVATILTAIHNKTYDIPLSSFAVNDSDDTGVIKYYGNTDRLGRWYILKQDTTVNPTTYRYTTGGLASDGTSTYTTAWTNRASLIYGYYHEVSF